MWKENYHHILHLTSLCALLLWDSRRLECWLAIVIFSCDLHVLHDRAMQDVQDGDRVGLSTTRTHTHVDTHADTHAHTYARTNCDHQPLRFPASATLMMQTVSAALCWPCTLLCSSFGLEWSVDFRCCCLPEKISDHYSVVGHKGRGSCSIDKHIKNKRVKIDMCQIKSTLLLGNISQIWVPHFACKMWNSKLWNISVEPWTENKMFSQERSFTSNEERNLSRSLWSHPLIVCFRASEGGILSQVDFNLLVNICMDFLVPLLGKLFPLFFISWIARWDVQSPFWGGQ